MNILPMLAGNMVGGYLLGKAKREEYIEDQKLKLEQQKQQQKLLDIQMRNREMEQEKLQIEAEKRRQLAPIVQSIFAKMSGQPPAATGQATGGVSFDPSFPQAQQGTGQVANKMAQLQLSPLEMEILSQETGIPFNKAAESERKQGEFDLNQQRFDRDATQGTWVSMPDGMGGTRMIFQPRFGGPAQGTPGAQPKTGQTPSGGLGYNPPKPELRTIEEQGAKYEQPFDPYSGKPVGDRTTKEEPKAVSVEAAGKIALANQALKNLEKVRGSLMKDGKPNWNVILQANAPGGGIMTGRDAYSAFIDALDARQRAASGASLTAQEVENYTKMYWPTPADYLGGPDIVKNKLDRLEGFLKDFATSLDPTKASRGRMDNATSPFPAEASKLLKEGVVTTFRNGRKGTLINGVAVEVK